MQLFTKVQDSVNMVVEIKMWRFILLFSF